MGQTKEINRLLIENCRKGDVKSQYRLYKMYSKAMYNICIRMVPDNTDAEDILQEAFVSAFKNLSEYKGEATFGAWLKRIVINKTLNHLRKNKPDFVDVDQITHYTEEENDEEYEINPAEIHYAIKELPEGARVILSLYILEGYKHKQIAELLKISESTSKSQYQRAKLLLKQKLTDNIHG